MLWPRQSSHQELNEAVCCFKDGKGDCEGAETACKVGGDVGVSRTFDAKAGQVYSAIAWAKITEVSQAAPGMFRARLTIHAVNSSGALGLINGSECNATLAVQAGEFTPIEIPACEMPPGTRYVRVNIRANNQKNDTASGTVLFSALTFIRLA